MWNVRLRYEHLTGCMGVLKCWNRKECLSSRERLWLVISLGSEGAQYRLLMPCVCRVGSMVETLPMVSEGHFISFILQSSV